MYYLICPHQRVVKQINETLGVTEIDEPCALFASPDIPYWIMMVHADAILNRDEAGFCLPWWPEHRFSCDGYFIPISDQASELDLEKLKSWVTFRPPIDRVVH